ncbi:hypothetical protein CDL15_Pgr012718 [Punica granatum]|uniref:Uncharacterized protein n=1 Tax=Punica granatum TaxID=22663 RepID=A0A218XE59_PUNGR|nr:hypothetical protein CDL15_Pgr012718 [Punica granatum]
MPLLPPLLGLPKLNSIWFSLYRATAAAGAGSLLAVVTPSVLLRGSVCEFSKFTYLDVSGMTMALFLV